jgi:cobalt/nickel transport system permease protein
MPATLAPLLAVHISANVLLPAWQIFGYVGLAAFLLLGSWKIREEEVSRVALMTAAFFVASSIHIRFGPASVHLLLNGLVGLMLGRRACLAIPVGLLLQAVLLGHGDLLNLGVNSCIIIPPALAAGWLFRAGAERRPAGWCEASIAVSYVLLPWSVLLIAPVAVGLRQAKQRMSLADEFRGGLFAGSGCVMLAVILQAVVLVAGGNEDWRVLAALSVAAHVPVAILEGIIVGFAAEFVSRVKPELLSVLHEPLGV